MASSPDGKPLGETPEALLRDSILLTACTLFGATAYGIVLTLYAICAHHSWTRMTSRNRRRTAFHLAYTTTMALLGTVFTISTAWLADLAYVKHRLYPDGPVAYTLSMHSHPSMVLGLACWVLINFMADGLVLWRFTVQYRGVQSFFLIATVPCLLYAGCICSGLLTVIQFAGSPLLGARLNYPVIYFGLSISLTWLTTLAIFGRLWYHRRHIRQVLGGNSYGGQYISVAAVLIESAALYAVFCLLYVILHKIDIAVKWVFFPLLAQVQIITPLLIIFRISQGRAWSHDTHSAVLSAFANQTSTSNNVTFPEGTLSSGVIGSTETETQKSSL